jgi:methionine synthase I (cobalamin-dependent)
LSSESFFEAAKKKILLFDGAMGTEIQRLNPKPEDNNVGNSEYKNKDIGRLLVMTNNSS